MRHVDWGSTGCALCSTAHWVLLLLCSIRCAHGCLDHPTVRVHEEHDYHNTVSGMQRHAALRTRNAWPLLISCEPSQVFDLGCGDGRIVIAAAQKMGAKRCVGVEVRAGCRGVNEGPQQGRCTFAVAPPMHPAAFVLHYCYMSVPQLPCSPNTHAQQPPS